MVAAVLMKPLYVVLAAEGHSPPPLVDFDLTVIIQLAIFLVLLVVLTKFVFQPFLAMQQERDANIDGAKEKAQNLDGEADDKIASYEEKMVAARKEAASIRAELRQQGEAQAAEVLSEARGESDAKIESARTRIATSAESARKELRQRADAVAAGIASKLLGREV